MSAVSRVAITPWPDWLASVMILAARSPCAAAYCAMSWYTALLRAARTARNSVTVTAISPATKAAVSLTRVETMLLGSLPASALFADHVADAADGVNELFGCVRVDFLAQMVDHDVNDVGARIKVIPPRILRDQGAAHHATGMPHQVLKHRVFFWRQLDEVTTRDLSRVEIESEICHFEHWR